MLPKIAKRCFSRWSPQTPEGAQSLLDQLERSLLAGKPSNDPARPPCVTAEIPVAAANFLIDAIRMTRGGVTPSGAFHLVPRRRGATRKTEKHAMIITDARRHARKTGEGVKTSAAKVAGKHFIGPDGAERALLDNEARSYADFIDDILEFGGEEIAQEYMDYLRQRAKK